MLITSMRSYAFANTSKMQNPQNQNFILEKSKLSEKSGRERVEPLPMALKSRQIKQVSPDAADVSSINTLNSKLGAKVNPKLFGVFDPILGIKGAPFTVPANNEAKINPETLANRKEKLKAELAYLDTIKSVRPTRLPPILDVPPIDEVGPTGINSQDIFNPKLGIKFDPSTKSDEITQLLSIKSSVVGELPPRPPKLAPIIEPEEVPVFPDNLPPRPPKLAPIPEPIENFVDLQPATPLTIDSEGTISHSPFNNGSKIARGPLPPVPAYEVVGGPYPFTPVGPINGYQVSNFPTPAVQKFGPAKEPVVSVDENYLFGNAKIPLRPTFANPIAPYPVSAYDDRIKSNLIFSNVPAVTDTRKYEDSIFPPFTPVNELA